jgi:hypothetical protein
MASRSTTVSHAARHAEAPAALPWPAAALTIGTLSAGLWLGIFWLVAALF